MNEADDDDAYADLLVDLRQGLNRVAEAMEANARETRRLADIQERTFTHLSALSGHTVHTRVHLAAVMQCMTMALPKVTETTLAKVMSIELEKAGERGWIEALEHLDEMSRHKATLPSETLNERLARLRAQRKEQQAQAAPQEQVEPDSAKSEEALAERLHQQTMQRIKEAERHLDRTRGRER